MQGAWIPEIHAGLAYHALSQDDPESAWDHAELGRRRYLDWLCGFATESADRPPIPLETTKILLSGARATLLAYGDSRILPPLCFVVHADGVHVFTIESQRVRDAMTTVRGLRTDRWEEPAPRSAEECGQLLDDLVRTPWGRVPPTTRRIFVQPPVGLWNLPFEEAGIPPQAEDTTSTLGDRYPLSYLPWSTVLSWASAPRTRSGEGLSILGGTDDEELRTILGGRPRNAPIDATVGNYATTVEDADVLHVRGPAPPTQGSTRGPVLRLDDGHLTPAEIAIRPLLADAVLIDPDRISTGPSWIAAALLAGGARSALVISPTLAADTVVDLEHELYFRLRTGVPRDRVVSEIRTLFRERGTPLPPDALRVWGPGHLPVYALTAKRGLGGLLLSWVLFLGAGFFVFRFFIRRYVRMDTDPPA